MPKALWKGTLMDIDLSQEKLLEKKMRSGRDDEIGDDSEITVSSEESTVLSGTASVLNLGSSIFNLMNSSIGAGILGLGYAASVLGTIQFVILLVIVVLMSAFTMDLVCACSKYAGCYQDLSEEMESQGLKEKIQVCGRDKDCGHRRIYSYEKIGELLFGKYPAAKYFINFIALFYLANGMQAYFIIMKKNLPEIVHDIAKYQGWDIEGSCWVDGNVLLGLMILFVQLPLAFFQHVNFLGFTSFIGMGCMMSFVGLVVQKQPEAAALCEIGGINYTEPLPPPVCHTENFVFTLESAYAVPMLLFAFMCHGNVLSIVAELKPSAECKSQHPSPKRLYKMIVGAITPTAILYMTTALFAYYSYFNKTASYLLELYPLWLDGDFMLVLSKILVTLCIVFSVPILHYPCRYSLWNLLHQIFPGCVPPAYDNGYPQTWNWKWFYLFAVLIQGGLYTMVVITDDFALVAALGGAIAGSCIVLIFPTMFYLKIHGWRSDSIYDKMVWLIGSIGVLIFVANTGLILFQHFSTSDEQLEAIKSTDELLKSAIDVSANVTQYT